MTVPERAIVVGGCLFPCADLLGRPEWTPACDAAEVAREIGPALITGGAGSIGSTLAARLGALGVPVCIADANESAMDALERELLPSETLVYRLCDVSDASQVRDTVADFQPRTIFHLAAKKHVKYAECALRNAVQTNVFGTAHVLDVAETAACVRNVVFASSDKAVAAANVLGESKRVAERLMAAFAAQWTRGRAASVRLCNVLGTAGNVLDHYVDEAKRGVTLDVWSRDMTRYFCSVHEAADLFLHAALRAGAPVITLDAGPATPIAELAARVCAILADHGIPARYEVSERFGAMHARHEELWLDSEVVSRPLTTPDVAGITYPAAAWAAWAAYLARAEDASDLRAWLREGPGR